jgi:hypothetical protein
VLVLKRIKQTLHLTAEEKDRETIERVVEVYEGSCPVAASIKPAIEITSELDLTTRCTSSARVLGLSRDSLLGGSGPSLWRSP